MIRQLITLAAVATLAVPAAAVAQADFRWERALPAGNEVTIHNVNGNIKVRPSTSGKVEIVGTRHGSGRDVDQLRADVQQNSRGIDVCVLYDANDSSCDDGSHRSNNGRNRNTHDWNNAHIDFEIAVPTNLIVSANAVSGDVEISGAQGEVSASSVSGNVRLDRLRASSVSATSVSGDVNVHIDEFTGRGDLSFHTVSGNVTLEMPRQLDADVAMSTVSGAMNSDYPLTIGNGRMNRRRIDARIGNGGRRLELNTVSGDVTLRVNR